MSQIVDGLRDIENGLGQFLVGGEDVLWKASQEGIDLSKPHKKETREYGLQERLTLSANGLYGCSITELLFSVKEDREIDESARQLLMRAMTVLDAAADVPTESHYPRERFMRYATAFAQELHRREISVDERFQKYLKMDSIGLEEA